MKDKSVGHKKLVDITVSGLCHCYALPLLRLSYTCSSSLFFYSSQLSLSGAFFEPSSLNSISRISELSGIWSKR